MQQMNYKCDPYRQSMYWRGRRLQKTVLKELITDWTTLGWQILDVPGPRILKHAAQSNANCEFQCSGAGRGGYPPECYSGASPFQHRSILKSFEGRLILQTLIHLLTKDKRQRDKYNTRHTQNYQFLWCLKTVRVGEKWMPSSPIEFQVSLTFISHQSNYKWEAAYRHTDLGKIGLLCSWEVGNWWKSHIYSTSFKTTCQCWTCQTIQNTFELNFSLHKIEERTNKITLILRHSLQYLLWSLRSTKHKKGGRSLYISD